MESKTAGLARSVDGNTTLPPLPPPPLYLTVYYGGCVSVLKSLPPKEGLKSRWRRRAKATALLLAD